MQSSAESTLCALWGSAGRRKRQPCNIPLCLLLATAIAQSLQHGLHHLQAPHLHCELCDTQAQLDDTAVRLAAQEAALRGSQQRQQLASLRAQLNALQHAPISAPATLPAKQASAMPAQHAGRYHAPPARQHIQPEAQPKG